MFKTLGINYVNKYFNTSALLGLLWDKKSSQNALVVRKIASQELAGSIGISLVLLRLAAAGDRLAAVKLGICKQPAAPCVEEISFVV